MIEFTDDVHILASAIVSIVSNAGDAQINYIAGALTSLQSVTITGMTPQQARDIYNKGPN